MSQSPIEPSRMCRHAWITGAGGFIGGHLVKHLERAGWRIETARVRPGTTAIAPAPGAIVFHLGGVTPHGGARGLRAHMAANRDLTLALYERASAAGARGFVFLSTSKVLGEHSADPAGVTERRRPIGAYAESKAAAEEALLAAHGRRRLPLTIIRPPLVYGPGVTANFGKLLGCLWRGIPLPLANARGRRSLVAVDNLVDALAAVASRPDGDTDARIWHVTDGHDLDVATLCRALAAKLGRHARLWQAPRSLLTTAIRLGGHAPDLLTSLFAPFRLDDGALRQSLGWVPPQSLDAALGETARWFQTGIAPTPRGTTGLAGISFWRPGSRRRH